MAAPPTDELRQAGERLRLALEMFADGVAMKRLSLRRQHPDEDEARLADRLRAWLQEHPGVAGDVPGQRVGG